MTGRQPSGIDTSRGQTAQDFAVGIGLFLLAVGFVFAFVPYVLDPYDAGAGASEFAQADRAATVVVGGYSVDDRPNELDSDATTAFFDGVQSEPNEVDELRERTGLPFTARVNVTVRNVETGAIVEDAASNTDWTAGAEYHEGLGGASSTRIVRTDEPDQCEPACRLVVRVW